MSHFIACCPHTEVAMRRVECSCWWNVGAQFKELFLTFTTLMFFSRYPSSASCVVTATGCSDSVVFTRILLETFCSVTLVCASLTSRGSLFIVILLLPPDTHELGCSALFSSASSLSTTSSPMSSLLLAWVLSSLLSSVRGGVPVNTGGDAGLRT